MIRTIPYGMEILSLIPALIVAVVCAAVALLHLSWALGGRWPGTDDASLFDTVVGGPLAPPGMSARGGAMPGPLACVVVAVLLACAGACVVACVVVDAVVFVVAACAVAVVFLARGVGGFFDHWLRPAIRGTRYERLNRALYSPLCLALAALTLVAVLAR